MPKKEPAPPLLVPPASPESILHKVLCSSPSEYLLPTRVRRWKRRRRRRRREHVQVHVHVHTHTCRHQHAHTHAHTYVGAERGSEEGRRADGLRVLRSSECV